MLGAMALRQCWAYVPSISSTGFHPCAKQGREGMRAGGEGGDREESVEDDRGSRGCTGGSRGAGAGGRRGEEPWAARGATGTAGSPWAPSWELLPSSWGGGEAREGGSGAEAPPLLGGALEDASSMEYDRTFDEDMANKVGGNQEGNITTGGGGEGAGRGGGALGSLCCVTL